MTKLLISDENPQGLRTEEACRALIADILKRIGELPNDSSPQAQRVLKNNIAILGFLSEAAELAEVNSNTLAEGKL